MPIAPLIGALVALAGVALLAAGLRVATPDGAATWLADELAGPSNPYTSTWDARAARPFPARVAAPVLRRWSALRSTLPPRRLAVLAGRIEKAGLAGALGPEEVVVAQGLLAAAGLLGGLLWWTALGTTTAVGVGATVVLAAAGALLVPTWLERRVRSRQDDVRRDLPDVLDLLAISVEAGVGFEAALELAGRSLASALGDELAVTIHEMELGRSRHDALHHLKRRVEVPELSNLVVALTQADALGMPLGRVLHAQAAELRDKRRQWAREKAAKLPVKILFPMVAFVFPAIMIVVLGPAAISIRAAFR